MEQNRIRVLVEARGKRACDFSLSPSMQDESNAPDIESKHWFLKKLERTYEATRRAIDDAEDGLLRWLRRITRYLESKSDPKEALMRQLRKADVVEVVYPPQLSEKRVRRYFRRFIRRRLHHHQRGLVINFLLLPLTGIMMIVPGPNIFFGWNAFRLVCHYLAREGGQRVLHGQCEIRPVPDQTPMSAADDQKLLA